MIPAPPIPVIPTADPTPQAGPRPRSGRLALALLTAVAVVAASAAVGVATAPDRIRSPTAWDPRVRDLVAFVESARGLSFKRPVPVYFLSPAEYRRASAGGDPATPTASDRRDAKREAGQLRALGLVEGDVDLIGAGREVADSGTLAFYSPDEKVVNVRGTKMSVSLRVTLAHELTHALQDQNLNLRLDGLTSEQYTAARAVIEGDAVATEDAYVAQLGHDDQQAYDKESTQASSDSKSELDQADVPDVMSTLFGLPYALGRWFVGVIDARSGSDSPDLSRIDPVFARMPRTTAEVFNPLTYLDHVRVATVTAPPVVGPAGVSSARFHGTEFSGTDRDGEVLGAGFLFVMLSERIDAATAMQVVDGWRGDAYRAAEGRSRDGKPVVCVSARIRQKDDSSGASLRAALEDWATALPSEAGASVAGSGKDATFRTCDPGVGVKTGLPDRAGDALIYPVARDQIAAGQIQGGATPATALCIGTAVVSELTLAELQSDEASDELSRKVDGLFSAASASC